MEKAANNSSTIKYFLLDEDDEFVDHDTEADDHVFGGHDAEAGRVAYDNYIKDLLTEAQTEPLVDSSGISRNLHLSEYLEIVEIDGEEDDVPEYIDVGVNKSTPLRRKPKNRALRILSVALRDACDMFDHSGDLLSCCEPRHPKHGSINGCVDGRERTTEDKVKPSVTKKELLSKQDDQIHNRGAPKKIRLCEEAVASVLPQDHETMQAEASWILNELSSSIFLHNVAVPEINKDEIFNILEMLHLKKIEIPFLAMYGKEPCLSPSNGPRSYPALTEVDGPQLKWHQLVWFVHNLDQKWLSLQRRKKRALSSYEMLASGQASSDPSKVKILRSLLNMLEHTDSESLMDDIDTKFKFLFSPDEEDITEKQLNKAPRDFKFPFSPDEEDIAEKQFNKAPRDFKFLFCPDEEDIAEKQFHKAPRGKTFYSICREAGLADVARMFGHLEDMHEAWDEAVWNFQETPEDVARRFVSEQFKTPKAVLEGARHMAVLEISFEPSIRQFVRERYVDRALVNVASTDRKVHEIIRSLTSLVRISWLDEEIPARELLNVQWLLIQRAEEEKLVKVTFGVPDQLEQDLYEKCFSHNLVSGCAELWYEQRKLIVKDALNMYLLPSMECEVRSRLAARSKGWYFLHGDKIAIGDI